VEKKEGKIKPNFTVEIPLNEHRPWATRRETAIFEMKTRKKGKNRQQEKNVISGLS
jgi:hypothetical protein